jgi:hypothetical protein
MIQLTPPPSLTFAHLFNSRNHQTPFSAPFFLLQRPLEPATLRASQLSIAGAFLLSLGLSFYAVRHVASCIKLQVNGDDRNHKSHNLSSICFRPLVVVHVAHAKSTFPARIQILLLRALGHPRLPGPSRPLRMPSKRDCNDSRNENA